MFLGVINTFCTHLGADGFALQVVKAVNRRVVFFYYDRITAFKIHIREVDLLFSFGRCVHAGGDNVDLTALQCRNKRIETETFNFRLHAHFFGNSRSVVDIKADILVVFRKFERRESGLHADD